MERSEEGAQKTQKRSCLVCGHPMGPLDRICDKCGSIRRPAKSPGKTNPPERHSSCERCGEEIPFGKHYCGECASYVKEHQKARSSESVEHTNWIKVFFAAIRRFFSRLGRKRPDRSTSTKA